MSGRAQICAAGGTKVGDRLVYYRGVSALESNQPQIANRYLSSYVHNQPHDPAGGLFLGMAQSRCGDVSAAYRTWRNADAAGFFWKRGVARNDPTDIETALAIGPAHVGMLFALGNAYAAQGRVGEAMAAYEKLIRSEHDQSTRYWMASAYISAARGSYNAALEQYRRASRSDPTATLPRYRVADMARKLERFLIAAEEYQKILELAPRELYATVGLAEMHWARRDIGGAERYLQGAIRDFPSSFLPPFDLASLRLQQNRIDEAVALGEEALRREPSSLAARAVRDEAISRRARAGRQK